MTRIIVFSDSHGKSNRLEEVVNIHPKAALYLHLGDGCNDIEMLQAQYPRKKFLAVAGNCDFAPFVDAPDSRLIKEQDVSIFLCHGHAFQVKYGLEKLFQAAKEHHYQIALFGHTHVPLVEYREGLYLMNPGSIGLPRDGKPSYGIIDLTPSGPVCNIAFLDFFH